MGDRTQIEWCDATWNPIVGCTRVSPACDHCSAVRKAYAGLVNRGVGPRLDWTGTVRCLPERLAQPLHWRKPRRIFPVAMGDLFHASVPDGFRRAVFGVMALTPHHRYQVLTKRPENALEFFAALDERAKKLAPVYPDESPNWRRWRLLRGALASYTGTPLPSMPPDVPWPLPNVWVGATIENQEQADRRIPLLLQVPAAPRWISAEPLLGKIHVARWLPWRQDPTPDPHIGWVVVGGETGPGARPMHADWVRSLKDQCGAAGVPFFLKSLHVDGKLVKMPEVDGRQWMEFPDANTRETGEVAGSVGRPTA